MSRYNVTFSINRVDNENAFITHDVGGFSVRSMPVENVRKLLELFFNQADYLAKQAEDVVNGMVASDAEANSGEANPPGKKEQL